MQSCPPLRAFRASLLETDLAAAAKDLSRKGAALRTDGTAVLSYIFKWFKADFANTEQGVFR